jgi:hypothetical protein
MSGRAARIARAAAGMVGALVADGAPAAAQRAEPIAVVRFAPPRGVLRSGDTARSTLVVRGTGPTTRRVWVGYSLQAPDGEWIDVQPREVELPVRRASVSIALEWVVPSEARGGAYRAVMAAWSRAPGTAGAVRLAHADRRAAFHVQLPVGVLVDAPSAEWRPGSHPLGRGRLRPEQVHVAGEGFRLRLLPGRCDGAELRTRARYARGEFTARMRTPRAPGSLSAFFLYADVRGGNDEVDIEIHNDGSRRMLLTVWLGGRETHRAEVTLPFDPAASFHDYTIRLRERELVLLADGVSLARWTARLPRRPMRVMANVWWPTWLECRPLAEPRELEIERIELAPETSR